MSTTPKARSGKPVTLAKSASGAPEPAAPRKTEAAKAATPSAPSAKAAKPKTAPSQHAAVAPATTLARPAPKAQPADSLDALPAKWNELLKAQSDAAMAWWQDAKDAKTLADALAINARHTRVQFELAADQAREMASLVQKSFEHNAERLRTLFGPHTH
jgi:hypothetical protein